MRKRPLQVGLIVVALAGLSGLSPAADRGPIREADYKGKIRVACVGDSITFGAGVKDRATNCYPAQLGRMLGDKWEVRNFGVSGATLLRQGDKPYGKEKAFAQAKEFEPDVVVIMLGTNDTKPQNWQHKVEFAADARDLVEEFARLPGKPRVFVCHPPPVPNKGNFGINERGVQDEIPVLDKVAQDTGAGVVDVYAALKDHPDLLPDNVHPDAEGATLMARAVYKALTGKEAPANGGR
jgi:lysophospholipase L1-like esterase